MSTKVSFDHIHFTLFHSLNRFLQYGVKELAEQITAMEEVFFNDIEVTYCIIHLMSLSDL